MICTCIISTILVLALWIPAQSNAATIVFSALFGFSSGTYVSMTPAIIQQLSAVTDIGTRLGAAFGLVSMAALTGNPIAGALVSRDNGGYLYAKVFCGLVMGIGSMFLIGARNVQAGWKSRKI